MPKYAILLCAILPLAARAEDNRPWRRYVIDASSRGADGVRLADVNGDGLLDMATGWEQGGAVRICLNPGADKVTRAWPSVTVGTAPDVEDALFVDMNADGQWDVVSCSEGRTRRLFVHWSPADPKRRLDPMAWKTEEIPASVNRMMWMFATAMDVDGKFGVDLVAGGKGSGAEVGWFSSPARGSELAEWTWHPLRQVEWLMSLLTADMDGDGDLDLVISDRQGARRGAFWLEHPGAESAATRPWTEHPIGALGREVMFLHLADVDHDGLEDVLAAVRPRELHWLRRTASDGKSWESHVIPLPNEAGDAKAVAAADLDGDSRLDLVFSCEHAHVPRHGLMWLRASESPLNGPWQPRWLSGTDGIKHDLVATIDLDRDGDLDVITTEETKNLGVIWYENPLVGR